MGPCLNDGKYRRKDEQSRQCGHREASNDRDAQRRSLFPAFPETTDMQLFLDRVLPAFR